MDPTGIRDDKFHVRVYHCCYWQRLDFMVVPSVHVYTHTKPALQDTLDRYRPLLGM